MPSDESDLWRRILEISSVKAKMSEQGYFLSTKSFREMTHTSGVSMRLRAPEYLSKDFWSKQPSFLVDRGYYVLRTGVGKFALLDENIFPKPYLSLETASAKELQPKFPQRFKQVEKAFNESAQENAALEQMRLFGIFDLIVADLFEAVEYVVGPRGNRSSSFDIFLKNKSDNIVNLCKYKGQEELDYSLWTEDAALLFEAKQTNRSTGFLDPGWHKLAYPSNRFKDYEVSLFPVYFLRRRKEIHIFVFPKIQFHESGIVLNDKQAMTPTRIYEIRT